MRLLTPRRMAVTAICAALTLGGAAPALAAAQAPTAPAAAPGDVDEILDSVGDLVQSILDGALELDEEDAATQSPAIPQSPQTPGISQTSPTPQILRTPGTPQTEELAEAIERLQQAAANAAGTGTRDGADTGLALPEDFFNDQEAAGSELDAMDADLEKALEGVREAVDAVVASAAEGEATTSAQDIQKAVQELVDSVRQDTAPQTGMSTLPATDTNPADIFG
ncbi:hypothetical protein [Streptomyces lichenis]|uniref:Secreted protein n=1 Tax=Streptomyces lichenis TaxID=2306967 RepID=A0ABT0I9C4_9ACTN|nr:hypothetical protein [Streptomyces lichenis]MCK8677922.1 hypothetical protein [Streptomyces lichenis]